MQTPWGDFLVCDAHVHFFSPAFFARLAGESSQGAVGPIDVDELGRRLEWRIPASCEDLAAAWKRNLDEYSVAKAALIASVPGDEDSVAAAVRLHPDRFWGFFMVNPIASGGVERVQEALAGGLLQGVCLFPAMHRYSIADPHVRPVFEAAAAHPGTVAFVHCGVLSVGVRRKLGLPSLFDLRYSNPVDLHAVALRFPQLRFVVPHFGAGYLREALMLCDLCPNVHLDTSSSNSWMRYEEAHLDLRTVFRRALDVAGPQRLLFGTDSSFFPRGWNASVFETQSKALYEIGVTGEVARLIFHDNLVRLFS